MEYHRRASRPAKVDVPVSQLSLSPVTCYCHCRCHRRCRLGEILMYCALCVPFIYVCVMSLRAISLGQNPSRSPQFRICRHLQPNPATTSSCSRSRPYLYVCFAYLPPLLNNHSLSHSGIWHLPFTCHFIWRLPILPIIGQFLSIAAQRLCASFQRVSFRQDRSAPRRSSEVYLGSARRL